MAVPIRSGTFGLVLAGLLVAFAGCGSLAQDPPTRGGTVTPAPVPTDSPTSPPGRASVPAPIAGETPNGMTLARLHSGSLAAPTGSTRT